MATICAAVLAKDEAAVLDECLETLAWADELLVVVDDATTDATFEIARRHTPNVHVRPFTSFPDQRNAALELATSDWVFFVDADERIPPALVDEVRAVVANPGDRVGYWVPRHNYIFGRLVRGGGWWPDYQPRLLRRGRARYDPQRLVHELALFDGPADLLREPLVHLNYDDLGDFLRKQARYSRLEAERRFRQGVRPRARSFLGLPAREFYRRFVALQGYRDGALGLALAALLAANELATLVKLAGRWRRAGRVTAG